MVIYALLIVAVIATGGRRRVQEVRPPAAYEGLAALRTG
jgi:hypothetical protein